jgi:hypothetical protein
VLSLKSILSNPEVLISDTALAKAAANFKRMGKDKKLMEALQGKARGRRRRQQECLMLKWSLVEVCQMMDPEDEEIMNMM